MPIRIGRYDFEGPFETPENLKNDAGVYAVIALDTDRGAMIDVGETTDIKDKVNNHERKQCWEKLSNDRPIRFAAVYTHEIAEQGRHMIEKEIRSQFTVPCGKAND